MVQVTRNFLAESPLAPQARAVLLDAFDQGWHDPRKIAQSSVRAGQLERQAIESLAENLGLQSGEIEVIGEPALSHFLAIAGLASASSTLLHSSVDRREILEVAKAAARSSELPVDQKGQILLTQYAGSDGDVVAILQAANGETGVTQNLEALISDLGPVGAVALDFTISGAQISLPTRWDCATYDSRAWSGPAGLGLLAIRDGSRWRNPLPHLSSRRTPHSFSLPLLMASAIALEAWKKERDATQARLRALSSRLRTSISLAISDCDIAGDLSTSLAHLNSLSFLYVQGEELLRDLERAGFLVDSGSACTAENMQPSHVLAAMGLLTHGNIRVTLHEEVTETDIDEFVIALGSAVESQRRQ